MYSAYQEEYSSETTLNWDCDKVHALRALLRLLLLLLLLDLTMGLL
jgi:hypothetical protein